MQLSPVGTVGNCLRRVMTAPKNAGCVLGSGLNEKERIAFSGLLNVASVRSDPGWVHARLRVLQGADADEALPVAAEKKPAGLRVTVQR